MGGVQNGSRAERGHGSATARSPSYRAPPLLASRPGPRLVFLRASRRLVARIAARAREASASARLRTCEPPAPQPPRFWHPRSHRRAFGTRAPPTEPPASAPRALRFRCLHPDFPPTPAPDRPSTSAPSRPSLPAHARLRACELPTSRPPSGTRHPPAAPPASAFQPSRLCVRIPTSLRHPRLDRRPPPFRRLRPIPVARRELAKISAGRSSDRPPCGPKARHG